MEQTGLHSCADFFDGHPRHQPTMTASRRLAMAGGVLKEIAVFSAAVMFGALVTLLLGS